jgi:hypothetical protein
LKTNNRTNSIQQFGNRGQKIIVVLLCADMQRRTSHCEQPRVEHQRSRHRANPKTVKDFVGRYPRVLGKIAEAAQVPSVEYAAVILRDAVERRRSYSEWVLMQYSGDAMKAVHSTLRAGM